MQLKIEEKRVLLRLLEKIKPANTQEINLLNRLINDFQYEIDSEQAAIMFPMNKITYLPYQPLLKAA